MKRVLQLMAIANTKILIFVLLLVCLQPAVSAQDTIAKKPNTIYIEGLGIGLRYSINYERQFQIKESNWGFSLSGGVAPNFVEPIYLYFPLRFDIDYQFGNSKAGIGFNYMWGFYWEPYQGSYDDIIRSTDFASFPKIKYQYLCRNGLQLTGELNMISEKWQPHQNVISYLVDLPFGKLELYQKQFVAWPGISIGYTF